MVIFPTIFRNGKILMLFLSREVYKNKFFMVYMLSI